MSTQKNVKIILNNGLEITVPRYAVKQVVLPSVVIGRSYHRLVIRGRDLQDNLKHIKKKFKL